MTLRESQDQFIEELGMFDTWSDKFNLILENSNYQAKELPEDLLRFRINGCQSRTYFEAENHNGYICISGWSNSGIMAGLIVWMKKMFSCLPADELMTTEIDFHIKSGLIDNVTPMRKAAILEMINRINVLSANK
jgi:sulfur transfer protein SufE